MEYVNIIGAGRVGQTLMRLLPGLPGFALGDVTSARAARARAAVASVGAGRAVARLQDMGAADLWIVSVPDDHIAAVAADLAALPHPPAVALHCSGFLASDALAPLQAKGWAVASCHPVLSFADPALAAAQFPGTFCALEGDGAALGPVEALVRALGGQPFGVRPERKAIYHAAAVISNNFTTVLQSLALEAWDAAGVPDEVARGLCASLLSGTADSVARLGPASALTGPAARGDQDLMARQQAALAAWQPESAALYAQMSALAGRLKAQGRALPQAPEAPRRGTGA